MKSKAPLQPFFLLVICTFSALTIGCGTSKLNDPPGIASTAVGATANPLVAQVTTTSALGCAGQVSVQFGPDTTYGRTTAWVPASASSQTSTLLVAGMRANTTYHMQVLGQRLCDNAMLQSQDMTFTTAALPSALPFPSLVVSRPNVVASSPENPGIEEVSIPTVGMPALFTDRDANPIWYYDVGQENYPYMYKLLSNGHMLLMLANATAQTSVLREVDLAGNTIRELDMPALDQAMAAAGFTFAPANFTHDFALLPNGHVVVITDHFETLPVGGVLTPVIGDDLVDLDENWNPVWAWTSFDHLDVNRHLTSVVNGTLDWTHANAVVYSPADGNLLFSFRHQSWILKIDYNNGAGIGDVLWTLGYQGSFALTVNGAVSTNPSDWFSFQHFPSIVSQSGTNTTLTIWDNGDERVVDTSGDVCAQAPTYIPCYSRATVFQLDESALTANLAWDNVLPPYSIWGGSINQLENGNVEYDLNAPFYPPATGIDSQVQEVTQTASPQVVWQMDVNTVNAYRAYRVPSLYPGVSWQY